MKATLVTPPAFEPVTVAELKEHLRVDSTNEDSLIERLIVDARETVEAWTRRAIITQTWEYFLYCFPGRNYIELPFGNLQSVTSVKYKDSNAVETTMTVNTDYIVESNSEMHGRIVLPYGDVWPTLSFYPSKPITIRFVCGWTTRALVPERIKQSIKLICAERFENRGESVIGQTVVPNKAAENLIMPLRLWGNF